MAVGLVVLNRLVAGKGPRRAGARQHAFLKLSLLFVAMSILLLIGLFQANAYTKNLMFRRLRGANPEGRLVYTDIAFQLIRKHPALGIGMGNFGDALFGPMGQEIDVPMWFYRKTGGAGVHNIYLLFAVESGILGGILFSALVLSVAWSLWRTIFASQGKNREVLALAIGLLVGWVSFAIDMFFELGFNHPSVQVMFFAIAGIAVALEATGNRQVSLSKTDLQPSCG
jgi:O-antigen ligase